MTRQQLFAEQILTAVSLFHRFLKGFDDSNYTKQSNCMPNHVAWTLGHLARTMTATAKRFGGTDQAESDFVEGDKGDVNRFAMDLVGFGSTPVDDPKLYPAFARCVEIFNASGDRLAAAIRNADDEKLDSPAKFAGRELPLWNLVGFMIAHNGNHSGQISDLRRALGLGSIFS